MTVLHPIKRIACWLILLCLLLAWNSCINYVPREEEPSSEPISEEPSAEESESEPPEESDTTADTEDTTTAPDTSYPNEPDSEHSKRY